jgi:hypothetical protein
MLMKKVQKPKKRNLPLKLDTVRLLQTTGGEPTIIVGTDSCLSCACA